MGPVPNFVIPGRISSAKSQTPNPKSQIPNRSQTTEARRHGVKKVISVTSVSPWLVRQAFAVFAARASGLGIWDLGFGFWDLFSKLRARRLGLPAGTSLATI